MKKKEKCHHPKVPAYTKQELLTLAWLDDNINQGDYGYYRLLTRLAVLVAVTEGRFTRDTCDKCKPKDL